MAKYTKEITALLTFLSAGALGSSVFAAGTDNESTPPTAGVPMLPGYEYTEYPDQTEVTPTAGVPMLPGYEYTEYPDQTEVTPTAGVTMLPGYEYTEYPDQTTVTPPPIGTFLPETKYTDETTSTPPPIGTFLPETKYTDEITPTLGDSAPLYGSGTTSTTPGNEEWTPIRGRGDIDKNGTTDLTDLTSLSMHLLGDITLDSTALIEADITQDDETNIADLAALKMIVMKGTEERDEHDSPENQKATAYIRLDRAPTKTVYKIAEPLDISGNAVSANGTTAFGVNWDIFSYEARMEDGLIEVDASEFNNQLPGTYRIFFNYSIQDKPEGISTYTVYCDVTVTE